MLSNTLNTNEIKKADGSEVEFTRLSIGDRQTVFGQIAESYSAPYRLSIKHQETGSGLKKRRRSVVRVDKTSISTVDNATPVVCSAYLVCDIPIGAVTTNAEAAQVLANVLSFCATTGAGTTVLFDGTGNGAVSLLNGSI